MGEEMGAAIVGAAIAALVAVILFVVERSVARHAAAVERRRLAFDEIIQSFGEFASATIQAKAPPSAEYAGRLLSTRARMSLALGMKDRALNWWLTGMEKRLGAAARDFGESPKASLARIDTLYSSVANTLIEFHLGALDRHDLVVPAAIFWVEDQRGSIPPEMKEHEASAERPRRDVRAHGFAARATRVLLWFTRPFRRRRLEAWLPSWSRPADK